MKSRQQYVESLKNKIDEWNEEIDRLSIKADLVEAESRLELQEQISSLKQKRRELEGQVKKLSTAGGEAWEDMKAGIDLAWDSMNTAVKSAVSRFLK